MRASALLLQAVMIGELLQVSVSGLLPKAGGCISSNCTSPVVDDSRFLFIYFFIAGLFFLLDLYFLCY